MGQSVTGQRVAEVGEELGAYLAQSQQDHPGTMRRWLLSTSMDGGSTAGLSSLCPCHPLHGQCVGPGAWWGRRRAQGGGGSGGPTGLG